MNEFAPVLSLSALDADPPPTITGRQLKALLKIPTSRQLILKDGEGKCLLILDDDVVDTYFLTSEMHCIGTPITREG